MDKIRHAVGVCLRAAIIAIIWAALIWACTRPAEAAVPPLTEHNAVLSIIGEAEGESFEGKVAVAETIRRRGSLKGVYGVNAPRVKGKKYSKSMYNECLAAWRTSSGTNYSAGAMGWGNAADVEIFNRQKWFNGCRIVKVIGAHYFWGVK